MTHLYMGEEQYFEGMVYDLPEPTARFVELQAGTDDAWFCSKLQITMTTPLAMLKEEMGGETMQVYVNGYLESPVVDTELPGEPPPRFVTDSIVIESGTEPISIRTRTKDFQSAGSSGPFAIQVCESEDECSQDLTLLTDLEDGRDQWFEGFVRGLNLESWKLGGIFIRAETDNKWWVEKITVSRPDSGDVDFYLDGWFSKTPSASAEEEITEASSRSRRCTCPRARSGGSSR
jgi:hypothetical protein